MSTAKSKVLSPIDWQAVGRRIRQLRGYDMNQADMANEVEIGQSHLSAIERGKKEPGAGVLYRIAKRYGRTMEWLLTGRDPQS
jgi:transcriptional regulator with XRE-family HTH domain